MNKPQSDTLARSRSFLRRITADARFTQSMTAVGTKQFTENAEAVLNAAAGDCRGRSLSPPALFGGVARIASENDFQPQDWMEAISDKGDRAAMLAAVLVAWAARGKCRLILPAH